MKESERQPEQNTIRSGKKRKKHLYTIYEEANKDRIAGEKPWTGTIHFDLDSTYSITGKTTGSILPDLQRITNRLSRTLNENTMAFSNPDNRRNSNEPEVGKGYFLYGIQGRVVVKVKKGDMLTISYPNQLNPNAEPTVEKMSVKDFKEKHAANNKKTEKKEGREKQYRVNYLNERWVISNKQDKPSKGVNLIQFSNDGSGHTFGFATFKELEKENVSLTDTLGKPLQDIVNEIALRGPQKKANATNVVPAGLKTKVEPTQIDTALSTQKKHLEPLSFQVDEIIEIFGDRYVVKEIASDNSRYLLVDQATRKEGWVERSSIDGLWSIAKENPIDIESILNDQAKAAVFQERGDNAFERGDIDGIIAVQTDIANKILELEKAGTEEYFINELYEVRGDLELKKNALIDRDISEEKEKRGDIGGIETDFSIGDRFENDGKIFVLKEIENYDDKDAILFVFNEEVGKGVWKLNLSQLEKFKGTMRKIEKVDPDTELQKEYIELEKTLNQLKKGIDMLEQSINNDAEELREVQQQIFDKLEAINNSEGDIETEKNKGEYKQLVAIIRFQLENPREVSTTNTEDFLKRYPNLVKKVTGLETERLTTLDEVVREKGIFGSNGPVDTYAKFRDATNFDYPTLTEQIRKIQDEYDEKIAYHIGDGNFFLDKEIALKKQMGVEIVGQGNDGAEFYYDAKTKDGGVTRYYLNQQGVPQGFAVQPDAETVYRIGNNQKQENPSLEQKRASLTEGILNAYELASERKPIGEIEEIIVSTMDYHARELLAAGYPIENILSHSISERLEWINDSSATKEYRKQRALQIQKVLDTLESLTKLFSIEAEKFSSTQETKIQNETERESIEEFFGDLMSYQKKQILAGKAQFRIDTDGKLYVQHTNGFSLDLYKKGDEHTYSLSNNLDRVKTALWIDDKYKTATWTPEKYQEIRSYLDSIIETNK
jgi:hypothetical protein